MRDWIGEVEQRLHAAQLDGAAEREIAEELAQHLQDRYDELTACGMTAAEARAQVLAELGEHDTFARRVRGAVQPRPEPLALGRPTFGSHFVGVLSDLRFGARMLVRAPLYTLAAVLVIALGIGANTVIFLVVNSVLLQPPSGVQDPERLVAIYTSDFSGPRYGKSSYPDAMSVHETGEVFDGVAAFYSNTFAMVGNGWSVRGVGEVVSDNYFHTLGVEPAAGRFFAAEEAEPDQKASVVVINYALAQRYFGGSAEALGKTVFVTGEPLTVIGVTPPEYGGSQHGLRTQLWLPISWAGQQASRRGSRGLLVRARLRDGVTIAAAQQRLNVIAARLHSEFPQQWTDVNNESRVFTVLSEADARVHPQMRASVLGFLGMLMVAVIIVLMIACTNVANLMLSRASARRSEMGIRLALGATRGHIVRHLLSESVLLACIAGVCGVLLAVWAVGLLNALRLPGLHVTVQVVMDWQVLAFATAITLATGILFGLAPALQASRAPAPFLKEQARGGTRSRLRHALIVVQVAASFVLLIGGGLFLRSLRAAQSIDTGYTTSNVVVAPFDLDIEGYKEEQAAALYDQLLHRVRAMPGTEAVTLADRVPLGTGWGRSSVIIEGYQPTQGEDMEFPDNGVAPEYFSTMGVPLRRGRDFAHTDRVGAPPVVIVSEAFVLRFWPNEDPVGKRIGLDGPAAPFAEVIGVAADAKYRSLDDEPQPYFYYPYLQRPATSMSLLARTGGDPAVLIAALRQEIRRLAPALPPPSIYTFRQHLTLAALPQLVAAIVLSALGMLALSIAAIGLYGIIAFGVTQRTREFGIRIALGAHPATVRRLVIGDALRLVGIGVLCGAPIAVAMAFVIRSFLMVPPIDPVSFIGVPLLLAACAVLASYAPARRATASDPATALRME